MREFSRRLVLFLSLGILHSLPVFAQPLDQELGVFQGLCELSAQDPRLAEEAALKKIKQLSPDTQSSDWLQTLLFLKINGSKSIDASLLDPKKMPEYLSFAQDKGHSELALEWEFLIAEGNLPDSPQKNSELEILEDKFISRARQGGFLRFAARLLTRQALSAYYAGDTKRTLSKIQMAYSLLEEKVTQDDIQMLEIKGNMANYLEYTGVSRKAEDLYLAVIAVYRAKNFRWTLTDSLANYSLLLMHQERFEEADKYLQEVKVLGEALQSDLLQGRALKSLGFSKAQQKKHKQAIPLYQKGLEFMIRAKEDVIGIADTQRILADSLVAEKHWEQGLKALDQAASEPTAMLDKDWERNLQQTRVQALTGLGRMDEAIRYSKRVNELLFNIMEEEKEKELSKLKISMGLQLEEQKNGLLTEQNRLQNDKLHDAEILRRFFYGVLVLATLVILLLLFALKQTLRAKRSRERMHRILEHIEEGILSIGAGMRVEADFSPYLTRLLGINPKFTRKDDIFMSLLKASDMNADERATVRSTLQASLGEEALTWELNMAQLPHELSIHAGTRHLMLDWQPVFNEHKTIQSVLITVRDITDRKALQIEVEVARTRASRLEQRLSDILQIDAPRAESFLKETQEMMPKVRSQIENIQDLVACSRQLHTLKGMARSMGFKEMSALVHDLEDQFDREHHTLYHQPMALQLLQELEQTLKEYAEMIHRVFRSNQSSARASSSLIDIAANCLTPVREMLERSGIPLGQVEILDQVKLWSKKRLEITQLIMIHGLTNSADHGFILPLRRGAVMSREAQLSIVARPVHDGMELELCDNGWGMDMQRLQELADKTGFRPSAGQSLADVVFMDGITTADRVSRSSGRGLGMAAIKQAIEELSGTVHLRPNPKGPGSSLLAYIPAA